MNTLCIVLLVGLTGYVRSVAVTEMCGDPTPACDDGLYCEELKCKAKAGITCSADPADQCIMGATCVELKCKCGDNHTPSADMTKCLKNIDQACTAADDDCVHGATCGGDAGSTTCMCNATTMVPKADKSMCLKKIDQACTAADDDCVHGATCGGVAGSTTCMCDATTMVPKADKSMCLLKIDGNCSAEGSMCVDGTTCKDQTCMCPEKSRANTDKDKCLKYIEEMCEMKEDCVEGHTDKVVCGTDKKCACAATYAPMDMMNMCKLKLNETCTDVDQCGVNTVCSTTCTCKANYVTEEHRCGMKVGGTCAIEADCVMNAECNSDKKCACKSTYTMDGELCKSGSAAVVASLLLMVAAFVTSRLM